MSTHVLRRRFDSLDLLERVLNKSSLSTKRVAHNHILDVGADLLSKTYVDVDAMKKAAVKDALEDADKRHTRELMAALTRMRKDKEAEKSRALSKQKQYYVDLACRVAEQRDRAEEEHMRELTRKHEKEKEEALRQQWEHCEQLKRQAIADAMATMEARLRREFALEKERAIQEALDEAAERFRIREQEVIAATRRQCEQEAAEEAARVAKEHAEQMGRLQERYGMLKRRYDKERDHRERVERDFRDLQTDYKRFMDYTGGKYSSSFMMKLRYHGDELAMKRPSVVQYEDIEQL